MRWLMDRDTTLSLGVPRPQRKQVESTYYGSIAKFIEDRIEKVFTKPPVSLKLFLVDFTSPGITPASAARSI